MKIKNKIYPNIPMLKKLSDSGLIVPAYVEQPSAPTQELYVPPTIDGEANPVLSEGVYHAYYVLKTDAASRSAKLMKGDVEVEGGATVAEELTAITEQAAEAVPEFAAYVGWKYDVVTVNAEGLDAGDYSIEYTADGLSDDSLAFEVADTTDYLCFTAEEEGAKMSIIGGRTSDKAYDLPDFKYSTDKTNWTQLVFTEGEEEEGYIPFSSQVFTLGLGEKVYFKGLNHSGFNRFDEDTGSESLCHFSIEEGAIAASGDIGTITDEIGGADCVLTFGCYASLFAGCISLTTAPSLPATTLAYSCYGGMFASCTSLTAAPELPATTFAEYCYAQMFQACTSLSSVTVGATSWNANSATDWLSGVAETGTFTKPSATEIPEGASGIPSGWTVVNV